MCRIDMRGPFSSWVTSTRVSRTFAAGVSPCPVSVIKLEANHRTVAVYQSRPPMLWAVMSEAPSKVSVGGSNHPNAGRSSVALAPSPSGV